MVKILRYISLPIMLVLIHWSAIYCYSYFCIPNNIYSIFSTAIWTGSPLCSALMSISEKTSSLYISSWGIVALFMLSILNDIYNKFIPKS